MSYQDKKVIAVTPAGRRRYLQILSHHILQNPVIDEWHLWVNTADRDDLDFMRDLSARHYARIHLVGLPGGVEPRGGWTIHHFWPHATEPEHIYMRFDDDIVWFAEDTPEKLCAMVCNPDLPDLWMASANIINNAVCDFQHQQCGALPSEPFTLTNECMCPVGWKQPEVAEWKHRNFFNRKKYGRLGLYDWRAVDGLPSIHKIADHARFSINCLAWKGETLAGVKVAADEEPCIASFLPKEHGKFCYIATDAMASHYAFFTQREHMDNCADILASYHSMTWTTP